MVFPCGSAGKESTCIVGDPDTWVGRIPLEKERLPTPVFWTGEFPALGLNPCLLHWPSQCTSPKHPVSCIEPGLATRFVHDILHVSMPFSQIFPPSPSPTESIRLFYTTVSLLLSRTQGYCYHLSKFHIYALVYCIGVFLSGLLHSV